MHLSDALVESAARADRETKAAELQSWVQKSYLMSAKDEIRQDYHRRIQRILRDPDGREAFKDFGIEIDVTDRDAQPSKPIVAILCPTYRSPQARMQDALNALREYTRVKKVATIYGVPPLSASVVHWSRNRLISQHLASGKPWTHILFIDDDIVTPPDALEKMLSHGKDIVAALCTRRQDPPIPNVRSFNPETGDYEQIWDWPTNALLGEDLIIGGGTGLMLISQHALEQVAQAYFDCMWEKEFYGLSEERAAELQKGRVQLFDEKKICYWFRFLPALKTAVEYEEDLAFCFVAQRYCGIRTYCDTSVQPGHIGDYEYGIKDFMPHRERAARFARAGSMRKKREQEPEEMPDQNISVLIPSRGRLEQLKNSVDALLLTAEKPEQINILVRCDDDDHSTAYACLSDHSRMRSMIFWGERHGYRNLHRYYNELADKAHGDWLMLWNDDCIMEESGWDEKIRQAGGGYKVINLTGGTPIGQPGDMNLFPVVHRSMYEAVGHFSLQAHCDTWWQAISRETNTEVRLPMAIRHERGEIREEYKTTSPEFFSQATQRLLLDDIRKIMEVLEAHAKKEPILSSCREETPVCE